MIVVGLERTLFQVLEKEGVIEVCATVIIYSFSINCPVPFSFEVHLSTSNGSAGNNIHNIRLPLLI